MTTRRPTVADVESALMDVRIAQLFVHEAKTRPERISALESVIATTDGLSAQLTPWSEAHADIPSLTRQLSEVRDQAVALLALFRLAS